MIKDGMGGLYHHLWLLSAADLKKIKPEVPADDISPEMRTMRLAIAANMYKCALPFSSIPRADYAVWCEYFTQIISHDDRSVSEIRNDLKELSQETLDTYALYFGKYKFCIMRGAQVVDAALIGIPDDPAAKRVCLVRALYYTTDYRRPPSVEKMRRIVDARKLSKRQRRIFARSNGDLALFL